MANRLAIRRTAVADKVPTTSDINTGELGLNMLDQILYSSNGTVVFELGANVSTQRVRSTLLVGNSTANIFANSTLFSMANSTSNTKITIPTAGQYSATNYFLHANGDWVQISAGGGTPGGNDTEIQFNDGGAFGGNIAFIFTKTTNTVSLVETGIFKIGNSTVNSVSNSSTSVLQNSTVSSTFSIGQLNIGANVILNTSGTNIGNSTVNAVGNSSSLRLANSTVNTTIDTARIHFGNSTVNTVANQTSVALANSTQSTVIETNRWQLGNSTVNAFANSQTVWVGQLGLNAAITSSSLIFNGGGAAGASYGVTSLAIGSNVNMDVQKLFIGNTTQNAMINSISTGGTSLTVANTLGTIFIQGGRIYAGNSTVNLTANSLQLKISNSTTNTTITSSDFYLGNTTFYVHSNTTFFEVIGIGYTQITTGVVGQYDGTYTSTLSPTVIQLGNTTVNTAHSPTDFTKSGVSIVPFGQQSIWVPAISMVPRSTNGPVTDTFQTATNGLMHKTLAFNGSTNDHAQFWVQMPKSWDESGLIYQVIWSQANTTTNFGVAWALSAVAFADGDAGDTAFGTEVIVTDTGGVNNSIYISPESTAVTVAGTPGNEEIVWFQLKRLPANASDTMTANAKVHGIKLHYTTNAATDD